MKDHEVPCFKMSFISRDLLDLEIHNFKHMISIQILMQYEFMTVCVKFSRLSGCSKSFETKVLLRTKRRYIVLEMACYFDSHLMKENNIIKEYLKGEMFCK